MCETVVQKVAWLLNAHTSQEHKGKVEVGVFSFIPAMVGRDEWTQRQLLADVRAAITACQGPSPRVVVEAE